MKRFMKLTLVLTLAFACNALSADNASNNEINVAHSKWGTTATASSEYGSSYKASNVLDGKWTSRETDKWNSVQGNGPHWIMVDLATKRTIHKVVIRHEGVYGEGNVYNTADFKLQWANSQEGPWTNLVKPIKANTKNITTHQFNPTSMRYICLFVDKGEQQGNQFARIFEIEVYSSKDRIDTCYFGVDFADGVFRKKDGRIEAQAQIEYILPASISTNSSNLTIKVADTQIDLTSNNPTIWLPATGETLDIALLAKTASGESELARTRVTTPQPSYFSNNGTIHIMSSSHQDIAWMDSPQFCRKWRDKYNVTPSIEMFKKNKDYRFTVESMMYLMDELEDHPERRKEVHQRTKDGLLEWGATYTQPYESMLTGEQMVRGMYLGRKWLHKTFPDCDTTVAWSPDVPGRAMQMPQILNKAGIPYLIFSRHGKGLYNWQSPDGTGVIAYSPGHYCEDGRQVFMVEPDKGAREVHKRLDVESDYFRKHNISPDYPLIRSWDFSPATDLSDLMTSISPTPKTQTNTESDLLAGLKVRYSTSKEFFESVKHAKPSLKKIVGERPNPWLYIHGPGHHRAVSASRDAGMLLPAAETFSTINCLLNDSFETYPTNEFFDAWKAACFPDHGWGGNKGDITDALFKEKLEYARDKGQQILNQSLSSITSRIKTDKSKGIPVVIFNTLSWPRSGAVTIELTGIGKQINLKDSTGQLLPHQILPSENGAKTSFVFVAKDIPSLGYKTYYVTPGKNTRNQQNIPASNNLWENQFYKIKMAEGGIKSIFDKQIKQEILRSDKFLGAEVFTMQSVGNGAGEFSDIQKTSMQGFDKLSNHTPQWQFNKALSGPVQAVFTMKQKLKHCTVEQKMIVFNEIKRIDFDISLLNWDGTKSREFRVALPVNVENGKIAYEVAMGVLEVGKDEIEGAAGERYKTACKYVHPREVLNFITASNNDFGVTMSSCVAVCDWIDPTVHPVNYPVLQPILLASRKSCHGLGPWYLQKGDHHYNFSILSHKADWKNGYRFGIESNTPLQVVAGINTNRNASLPEQKSFFSVSADNVVISTIKKCDDDNSVVARLYDIEGKTSNVNLNTFFDIKSAQHTNIIEEEGNAIPTSGKSLKTKIGHHAIETFKLTPGN